MKKRLKNHTLSLDNENLLWVYFFRVSYYIASIIAVFLTVIAKKATEITSIGGTFLSSETCTLLQQNNPHISMRKPARTLLQSCALTRPYMGLCVRS